MIEDDGTLENGTETSPSANTQRVGRRLATIREELGRFYGDHNWSQTAVGNMIGLTQNIITRMEHGKGGLMENWLKVLNLYESQGYNLKWILTEDNSQVSKLVINESTIGQVRDDLLSRIGTLRSETLEKLDELQQVVENVPTPANVESTLSFLGGE